MSAGKQRLSAEHRRELEGQSVIDTAIVAERGYETITADQSAYLSALGIQVRSRDAYPGLLLPMFRATGERISAQFKPAKPIVLKRGRTLKYLSPLGQPNHIDVHPRNRERIRDTSVPLWITEGIKKGDSLATRDCCVATLTGVFNWRSRLGTLGDWEDVPLKGRTVFLCFDADAKKNLNVARAMVRLGRWCRSKGASVRYLIVPAEVNNTATKGVDDYFAAGGTIDALTAASTTDEPETETFTDAFSDSRLAEVIAEDVLEDRFVWCKTLDWLSWTGKRWSAVTEIRVGETIRRYALRRFDEAARAGDQTALKGWRSMLKASRQSAVLNLARGIVELDADDFDSHPDLLNTPGGVVNLQTGSVQPHDPDLRLTKLTRGSYRPEYSHSDWDNALSAVQDDGKSWLQVRVGQAITGHTTPDGLIVIAQGSGENGKTTVLSAVMQALGDYGAPCSPKLIATAREEHSTERADLRGQRFLVAEELTENRALNVTAIKQVTDVVQIKARHVHKDNQTFPASHSLFITTNYIPVVNETDHGTWRRLALLVFPFVYRKPGELLIGPNDRHGDPWIKARLKASRDGQHDAVVTWAVEGAIRWYAYGFPTLPPSVDADTRAWRKEADRILGFWDERLVEDSGACIVTTDLMQTFNAWMRSNGHSDWSKELFGSRFKGHEETKRRHVEERRPRNLQNLFVSRPPNAEEHIKERPHIYIGVRFRAAFETSEDTNDTQTEWSKRTDVSDIVEEIADHLRVVDDSDRSDRACCHGGSLVPACKLCRQSPTYWEGSTEVKANV